MGSLVKKGPPPDHRYIIDNFVETNNGKMFRTRHNKGTRMNQMANENSVINAKNGSSTKNMLTGSKNAKHLRIVQPAKIDKTKMSRYIKKFAAASLAAANWSTRTTRKRLGKAAIASGKLAGELTVGATLRATNAVFGTQLKKGANSAYASAANIASKKSKEFKKGVSYRLKSNVEIAGRK